MSTQNEQVDINVSDLKQSIIQHAGEPRDFDYRANALNAALSARTGPESVYAIICMAQGFEGYLRTGQQP